MNAPEPTTTRPYLIRALHEWCTDNGFTPYVAVRVDNSVQVPREYVNDGEIVLNVGFDATSSLQLGNDYIEFKARFGGKSRDILVPVGRVVAIYARENGQGMAFPPPVDLLPDALSTSLEEVETVSPEACAPDVTRVVQLVATDSVSEDGDKPRPPTTPGASRPALKLVK
ncbi:MAG TPA: ClpXP protease specificity-enhancing factor [Giesbergeria sp.]|nr:ClpXP protease specificity-enhancing factor [Giesbergeria sp.]